TLSGFFTRKPVPPTATRSCTAWSRFHSAAPPCASIICSARVSPALRAGALSPAISPTPLGRVVGCADTLERATVQQIWPKTDSWPLPRGGHGRISTLRGRDQIRPDSRGAPDDKRPA